MIYSSRLLLWFSCQEVPQPSISSFIRLITKLTIVEEIKSMRTTTPDVQMSLHTALP